MTDYKPRALLSGMGAHIRHTIPLPQCCPISGNPMPGSKLTIEYAARRAVLPVEMLGDMVMEYIGGHAEVREMEAMIQHIAKRLADYLQLPVFAEATLIISPGDGRPLQSMKVSLDTSADAH